MTLFINCESIGKSYGSHFLFKDISFGIFEGNRLGIIGPNGSGKSTLMKILAGIESPDRGQVIAKRSLKVGYVPQYSDFPPLSVEEILLEEAEKNTHLHDYERHTQVDILISKMGFTNPQQNAQTLSGGWKKRLDIAKQAIKSPDLILFDEPTNHLDLEGILWLENFLLSARFAYVIVSHDRTFLDRVTNRMMELNARYPAGIFSSEGNYSLFLERREDFLSGQVEFQKSLNSKVRNETEWLKQNPKARTTKAQSRVQQAHQLQDQLQELKGRNKERRSQIAFAASDRLTHKLLAVKNVSKSIGGKCLFSGIDFTFSPGVRLGIVGENGTGKTTLLKIFAGELQSDMGTVKIAEGIKIVYFDQHRTHIPPKATLREALAPDGGEYVSYRGRSIHVNSWCKQFLFSPDRLALPFGYLSGGEKARVLIARFMLEPADILLLDEPTNDLDIPTLEVLEESLSDFPGAIALITHDRTMMEKVCNAIIGLGVEGNHNVFADYSQWEVYQKAQSNKKTNPVKVPQEERKAVTVNVISEEGTKKKLTYKEKLELDQMEEKIHAIEKEMSALHEALNDPSLAADPQALQQKCEKLHEMQSQLEKLYERWQELEKRKN